MPDTPRLSSSSTPLRVELGFANGEEDFKINEPDMP